VQLQQHYKAFQANETEIVALAVASPSAVRGVQQAIQAAYTMLADRDHEVASAFGVYNLLGDQIAAPSVFIIDADGQIVWRHVGQSAGDRPNVQTILDNLP
jgi:peroxiredoxin